MNTPKKVWTFKSNLMVGLMFLIATIILYLLTKPEIATGYINIWFDLLVASAFLSIAMIVRGLTDKKPDK